MEPFLSDQIVIPSHISRTFVKEHRDYIFVYGFDVRGLGCEGQPWAFHGESNCYPVPTLEKYCPSSKIFFNDGNFTYYANIIDDYIDKIARDAFISKKPVIPCRKIGMGCSQLHFVAPRLFAYLQKRLNVIQYPDIKWRYA